MVDREKMLNVRLSADELRMLSQLSDELGVSQSGLVRQWIRREHEQLFGTPKPKRPKR
jgi:hypothetical protein